MKVTTDTPELLIVDDNPILLAIMLTLFILIFVGIGLLTVFSGVWAGLIFVFVGGGLGFGAFAAFVRHVQLVCHRPEGWIELRRRTIFGMRKIRYRLDEISRAELEESSSSDGGRLYRVALVIEQGESVGHHPLTEDYSNSKGHGRVAEAVNRWLASARQSAEAAATKA